jgi:flagellar basal body-associated protein FliL
MVSRHNTGKILWVLLVILILLTAAAGGGYYFSLTRFQKKVEAIEDKFSAFESKHEKALTSIQADQMDINAYIKNKEGQTEEETRKIRLTSILLKAKGEVISSKISLSQDDVENAIKTLDTSISVLKNAYQIADEDMMNKIEDLRLQLATIKGLVEVNSLKAQAELDKIWREIEQIISNIS